MVTRMRQHPPRRRGIILMLSAIMMVFLLGVIAFAVDLGFIANIRTDVQRATDSAAFAGAGALINGTTAAPDRGAELPRRRTRSAGDDAQQVERRDRIRQLEHDEPARSP